MAPPAYDDETLMAFTDGVLDEETSMRIEAALEQDPGLAERIAALAESRRAVRDLYAPLAERAVPAEMVARIEAMAAAAERPGATVVDLAARRARRPAFGRFAPAAIAASLAALLAAPAGYLAGRGEAPERIAVGSSVPAAVASLLDGLPSGERRTLEGTGEIRTIATFRSADGALCREFEVDGSSAFVTVACREDEAWRVAFAVEAPLADGYAPAGALQALDAYLQAVSAGAPMSADEERAALAAR